MRCLFLFLFFTTSLCAQHTLILQPGPECGKDALVWFLEQESPTFGKPWERNFGESYLPIMEWTWGGIPGHRWVLLDFTGLQQLPADANILEARLSLYHLPGTGDGSHSTPAETGLPHHLLVQRIIEPWEESEVTWETRPAFTSTGALLFPAPVSNTQHFEELDVTPLVRDMVSTPTNSFGLLLRMELDEYYQKLIFASSDEENPALRPKLEIIYEGSPIPPPPDIFTEKEVQICPGEILELNAGLTGSIAFQWQDGSSEPIFLVEEAGSYSVSVSLESCRTISDNITVVLQDCPCRPTLPNAFSPNGDGINDRFGLLIQEECKGFQMEFRIFNRWGKEVFYTTVPSQGWDGAFNGRPAPGDTYFYTLRFTGPDGAVVPLEGDFTLIR